MSKITIAILLLAASISAGAQQPAPALFGRLTANETHIVFSYAGDLWSVDRSGGEARRLTTHPGEESFPVFSPDGSQLAFSRQIGGNWDIYVMAASGGDAKQVTFHPRNDYAYGWTPDGKSILFMSNVTGGPRLYTISIGGVLPTELPLLPEANNGSFSPDGRRVAYAPTSAIGDWRFYRGGSKGRIWLGNAATGEIEKLSEGNYNDDLPVWVGDKVLFVSDRTGIYNLYSYDLPSKQTEQLTNFDKYGVRWIGAGGGAVVFLRDGRIYLHDISSGRTRAVDVRVNADSPELKLRTVNAARTIEWVVPSANGDRIIFGARGEVLVFDPSTADARNVTASAGAAERFPALSPDGKSISYFSDESGEYQLHVRPATGDGPVKKLSIEPKPSFYRELTWSPDSKKIAFTDHRLALWVADVESGAASRVDTSVYSYQEEWRPLWSPDSRWLTYSKHLHNRVRTVFIYDAGAKRVHQITDGRTHSELPCFDASGKYLYFASSANAGTSEYGWGVLNGILARPLVTRRLHAIVLSSDGAPPILPTGTTNAEAKAGESVPTVRIDFENIERRVVDLPTPQRDYALLAPGKPGVLVAQVSEWPVSPAPNSQTSQVLYRIDLSGSARLEKLVENIGGFEITRDGSRLLYAKAGSWFLVPADAAPKPDDGKLDLKKLEVTIDPRAEWKQMYREGWRIMRDWFYEPGHHGRIATITLNRPDRLNAINTEMRDDFTRLFTELQTNDEIGVIIFTGAGRAFSAGGDIGYFEHDWNPREFRAENHRLTQFFDELEVIEKPVLAAINGPCTGAGLQITLSCDIRIASDQAQFGFRENNIGLIPGAGGCSRLVKLIGYGKAKELIFTGEMISSTEAERIGLVNRVVPHDELLSHARALAEHLLTRAPEALGLAKRILWHSVTSDFATGRMLEALAQSILIRSNDHREGIRAFREKRKPEFKGE